MSLSLVDMDGVLVNFDLGHVDACVRAGYPARFHGVDRKVWDILDGLEEHEAEKTLKLWHEPNFYRTLEPLAGAVDGVKSLVSAGHDVFICTAPLPRHATCAKEKLEWIEHYLGPRLAERTIITRDKTLVHGDYLVDDKPVITGARSPSWKHLLFEATYNLGRESVNWRSLVSTFCSTTAGG